MKSCFAYLQPNPTRKPSNNLKISGETTIRLGLSCKLNPHGHPANDGKDVGEQRYLDKM